MMFCAREIVFLRLLRHPNIVALHEAAVDHGKHRVVMVRDPGLAGGGGRTRFPRRKARPAHLPPLPRYRGSNMLASYLAIPPCCGFSHRGPMTVIAMVCRLPAPR
jgi:hypothetical protein